MVKIVLILFVCGLIAVQDTLAKPTVIETALNPLEPAPAAEDANLQRDQRSPDYGFDDYNDYGGNSRHLRHKHGCRKHHGCGGHYHRPGYGGGYGGGHGGSFASASAGSFGSGHNGGGGSQAQAASLSVGPISISTAQAQSNGGGGYGGNGGYGGFGGFDY